MASRTDLQARLEFRRAALDEMRTAYLSILKGHTQSYTIGSRSLTKFDLPELEKSIRAAEKEIDALESVLNGGKRRKAVGVIPSDW